MHLVSMLLLILASSGPAPAWADEASNAPPRFLGNESIPPYIWVEDGQPRGLVVDLARALAQHASLDVRIEAMDWPRAQALVRSGAADALLQINRGAERESLYDFSDPLVESHFHLFRLTRRQDIQGLASLTGQRVGVEAGGLPLQYLRHHGQVEPVIVASWPEAFEKLEHGQLDAVFVDRWVGEYELHLGRFQGISVVEPAVVSSTSRIAVAKGNRALLARIDAGLRAIAADGTRERILSAWRGKEIVYVTRESIDRLILAGAAGLVLILSAATLIALAQVVKLRKANRLLAERERALVPMQALRESEAKYLRSSEGLSRLADASLAVMSKTDLGAMLEAIAEAALALTGARLAICGHGLGHDQVIVECAARVDDAPACPPGAMFRADQDGVHLALLEGAASLLLTEGELRAHPKRRGLPEGHVPLRGLLGVPLSVRGGAPSGMILVTDRAQGDFEAEDAALLGQLATVASLALQHVEARLALEEADRRKDQFLAMLGHELRNPLAPIRNSLAILEQAPPGGTLCRQAQSMIDRQVTHLTSLVDDLLDVTRIARGKITLQLKPLELRELVRCAVDDYRDVLAKSELVLELGLPEQELWMSADRTRLVQVIGNLLSNAAKFTPPGGRIQVSLARDPELGQAILRVRDTGIGIAPEMLPRVLEPFVQADSTLERGRGGLGLGLATVKGLIELHGGRVRVASAGLGEGAELRLQLPLEPVERPSEAPSSRRVSDGKQRQVLIIEDNRDAGESLRLLLSLAGHRVELASSGPEGLEKARALGPDLILCDIGLPGMDGYAVAHALRQDPPRRGMKLVALSGYAAPGDVAKALSAGFDAHLAKPPSLDQLTAMLRDDSRDEGVS